ncbi:MAG: hypothetical protein MJE77_06820, partial [Proteobacteria bacterium]|nr:hypothetical protein [Pseudomonadota bacterium]
MAASKTVCEHGNAILSRYPLGNARLIRHAANKSWYLPPEQRTGPGEPRLGGRAAVVADARVGDRIVHLYSLHFESGVNEAKYRNAQAAELAEHGLGRPGTVVQGGDANTLLYFFDIGGENDSDTTTQEYFNRGYRDAHRDVGFDHRPTHGPLILDLILTLTVLCHGPDRQVIDLLDVFGLSYSQGGERGKEDVVGSPCGGQLVLWQHGHRG